MSTETWFGPKGSQSSPKSGLYTTASNWSGKAVPGVADDVVLGSGAYTVSVYQSPPSVRSLTVNTGATFQVGNPNVDPDGETTYSYTVLQTASNSGTINLSGEVFSVNGLFTNAGTINGTNEPGSSRHAAESIVKLGTGLNNTGTITARTGRLEFDGPVRNVSAGGVLSKGTWQALGNSALLDLSGTPAITTDSATIVLSGAGSVFETETPQGGVTRIEDSLKAISSAGTLKVLANRGYTTANNLSVAGQLQLGGGTLSANSIVGRGGTLSGYGQVSAPVSGDLIVSANVAGKALVFTAAHNAFSDTIGGAGIVEFAAGTDVLNNGTTLSVARVNISGGHVTLGTNLTYAGHVFLTDGYLDAGTRNLTLTGTNYFSAGNVLSSGNGAVTVQGAIYGAGNGFVDFAAHVVNNGTINTLGTYFEVDGNVTGTGKLVINGAALELNGATSAGQTVTFGANGGTLQLDHVDTFAGKVSGLAAGDIIDVTSFKGATVNYVANANGTGGALQLTSADSTQHATIGLLGHYQPSGFSTADDASGHGTAITYTPQ